MPNPPSTYVHFAVISPGLEPLLAAELRELGLQPKERRGGVEWRGTLESLWLVHHRSRLTESVRTRLHAFRAPRFHFLESGLDRVPWHAYLHPGLPVKFDISCHRSKLYHSGAVEARARKAVAARLRSCPAPKEKDELFHEVHLRIDRDEVLPSIEATGELLHRRGYRKHVGVAPLRETLAAACARLLDDADRARVDAPVWDPCCGSGTMLCEWLLSGTQQSACGPRKFAFERWPIHNSAAYEAWLGTLPTGSAATERRAIGSDRNRRVLTAAKHNAERASLGEVCEWREGDFREVADNIPVGYRVLTNLPYGKRIAGSHQSAKVFAAMDALVAKRSDLRPALVLVVGDPPERARCDWKLAAEFPNGGIRVKAWIVR